MLKISCDRCGKDMSRIYVEALLSGIKELDFSERWPARHFPVVAKKEHPSKEADETPPVDIDAVQVLGQELASLLVHETIMCDECLGAEIPLSDPYPDWPDPCQAPPGEQIPRLSLVKTLKRTKKTNNQVVLRLRTGKGKRARETKNRRIPQ